MFPTSRVRLAALAALLLAFPSFSPAHEGHDHGPPPSALQAGTATPRTEASGDSVEMVAIARGLELIVYVDVFRGNTPVLGAQIEVETPAGPQAAVAKGDAYVLPAPWLAVAGAHDLIFTITAGDEVEILTATLVSPDPATTTSPAGHGDGIVARLRHQGQAAIATAAASAPGAPMLLLAIGGGFLAGMLVVRRARRPRRATAAGALLLASMALASPSTAHEGHDHGDGGRPPVTPNQAVPQRLADGSIFVPKPTQRILAIRTLFTEIATHRTTVELPGRIIPDPNASGFVQASVSGRLQPPPGGFPPLGTEVRAGDVLALVFAPLTAAEISDQRQRQGELDQQIALMERRLARLKSLDRTQAVARAQLEDANLELAGLRDRRAALDRARREPEALVAPVHGRIAAANAVAGQIAETNAIVFHIVDPARLWVEALSYAPLPGAPRIAFARDAAGRSFALGYQGSGFADRNQAIPMHLRIEGTTAGLRLGQFVTVLIETSESRSGVVVPRDSVLRGPSGLPVVYEHVAAERFAAREVHAIPIDGERLMVVAGLERGRRVVTQGAELLNQIR
jgi:cobalt-zinc-cadmium efflux system membrane fusion protein